MSRGKERQHTVQLIRMVRRIVAKSILNKHKKRDEWFLDDYSINPYQGCSFGCIYCYTRGSKYGTHLAKDLSVKINAPEILEKQLFSRAKKNRYGIIAVASQEPYLPIEKELRMTRRLLEIISKNRFPVNIGTKSTLVLRDLDVLREIDLHAILPIDLRVRLGRGAIISFSFSTIDRELASIFEPRAPTPRERFQTMQECAEKGFLTGANFIPVLPFLSDSNKQLDEMIGSAKEHGACFVLVGGLTLFGSGPEDCRMLYYKTLEKHFPELVPRYRSLFRIFFAPPEEYQRRLEETSRALCEKHGVRYGII